MSTPPYATSRRRRFTVSIRTLMLLVLISGLWMGWTFNGAETRRKAVEALMKNGAIILYDYESMRGLKVPTVTPRAPVWLRKALGDDYFQNVTYANLTPAVGRKYTLVENDLAPLAALNRLEDLVIVNTPLTDAGLAHLEGLTSLRRLCLPNLTPAGNPKFTDAGLARLSGMTQLQELGLMGAGISDAGLAHLSRMTDLQSLSLVRTKVTGPGLAHLSRMTKLKTLLLKDTPLTDDGLVQLRGIVSLQELWLNGTQTTDAGLANLEGLTSLRKLNLGPENCTDAGLSHLAGLASLQELDLPGIRLTDIGLAYLTQLKNLKEFYINDSAITDAGLTPIGGLTNLRVLVLVNSPGVTDAGLVQLRGLTRLEGLHVDQTHVSDQGLAKLKAALPLLVTTTNTRPSPPVAGKSKAH